MYTFVKIILCIISNLVLISIFLQANIDIACLLWHSFEVYFILYNYVALLVLRQFVVVDLGPLSIEILYAMFNMLLAAQTMTFDALPWNVFSWGKRLTILIMTLAGFVVVLLRIP
eukprot:UN22065